MWTHKSGASNQHIWLKSQHVANGLLIFNSLSWSARTRCCRGNKVGISSTINKENASFHVFIEIFNVFFMYSYCNRLFEDIYLNKPGIKVHIFLWAPRTKYNHHKLYTAIKANHNVWREIPCREHCCATFQPNKCEAITQNWYQYPGRRLRLNSVSVPFKWLFVLIASPLAAVSQTWAAVMEISTCRVRLRGEKSGDNRSRVSGKERASSTTS